MSFQIVRNDITNMAVDAIVNTANCLPAYGRGTDSAVYHAAGMEQLLRARREIGTMKPGQVAVTDGYVLPADYIIHAVCVPWEDGESGERETLELCYSRALAKAAALQCENIAIPLMGAGSLGFPRSEALAIAMQEIRRFLANEEMDIYLVVYDEESTRVASDFFGDLESYIDDNYVETQAYVEADVRYAIKPSSRDEEEELIEELFVLNEECDDPELEFQGTVAVDSIWKAKKARRRGGLEGLQDQLSASFADTLQRHIDERGMENAKVYMRACLSKQTFNKIINGRSLPKKNTILILAVTLQLSLDETIDLLAKAGHALSPSSLSDMVIRYFLENEIYDWEEIDNGFIHYHLTPLISD